MSLTFTATHDYIIIQQHNIIMRLTARNANIQFFSLIADKKMQNRYSTRITRISFLTFNRRLSHQRNLSTLLFRMGGVCQMYLAGVLAFYAGGELFGTID